MGFISPSRDTRILDVGCGAGRLLYALRDHGVRNILGIDPFIENDIKYENGLVIQKRSIEEVEGEWDVVMFNHSFEHLADPAQVLKIVSGLLSPNGHCMIRIPTASSYAWRHYGVNWVQLDAPRHFYLHSIKSMSILSEQAGLNLRKIVYDSTRFQFWGSEQYAKGIHLLDKRSYGVNRKGSMFSSEDIASFEKRAKELNKINQGDQAIFYLQKS